MFARSRSLEPRPDLDLQSVLETLHGLPKPPSQAAKLAIWSKLGMACPHLGVQPVVTVQSFAQCMLRRRGVLDHGFACSLPQKSLQE